MKQRRKTGRPKKPTLARKARQIIRATGYPEARVFLRGPKPPKENELGCFYEDKRMLHLRIDINFRKWSVQAVQVLSHELAHYKLHRGYRSIPEYVIEFEAELQSLYALRWVNLYDSKYEHRAREYIRQHCRSRFRLMGARPTKGWRKTVMDWCRFSFPKPPVDKTVIRYKAYPEEILHDRTLSVQEMTDIITNMPKHFWVVLPVPDRSDSFWISDK